MNTSRKKKHAARMRIYASTSLRAQRSNPPLSLLRYGLLRVKRGAHSRDPLARNDDADRDCSIAVS
jgi:hypothetical protein